VLLARLGQSESRRIEDDRGRPFRKDVLDECRVFLRFQARNVERERFQAASSERITKRVNRFGLPGLK
jgi:hypothetical protein